MKLSNFTTGRDNNFNLIRIIAAFAVLVTHSFALSAGSGDAEPFYNSLGMTLGSFAVDIFFITSGFLVTASLLTRQSVIEYFWARLLRIYPALLVMIALTVFGLGLYFTSLPAMAYLTDPKTLTYLLKSGTLLRGVAYDLPGVFDANPYRSTVNGSLWTMPYEMTMYEILALVWIVVLIARHRRVRLFQVLLVSSFFLAGALMIYRHFTVAVEGQFVRLYYMFFTGASFYILKEYISLSRPVVLIFAAAFIGSAFVNKDAFFVAYAVTVPYILFYLAYVPSGFIRRYNELGDYSYGTYIYAFPVQQSIVALVPGISAWALLACATPVTLLLAALSWHGLERRALSLKKNSVGKTRKMFSGWSVMMNRQSMAGKAPTVKDVN